jgi:hypothetical protein
MGNDRKNRSPRIARLAWFRPSREENGMQTSIRPHREAASRLTAGLEVVDFMEPGTRIELVTC